MRWWVGVVVWVAWLLVAPPHGVQDLIAHLLGLAMLVGIPLVWALSRPAATPIDWLLLPAALLAVLSFFCPVGVGAACLALPWLGMCLALAVAGMVTRSLLVRIPMNETIDVWRSGPGQLEASHQVWLCGLPMLALHYRMGV